MNHPLSASKKSGASPTGLEGHIIVGFGELMPAGSTGSATLVILTQKFKKSGVFDYFVTLVVPTFSRIGGDYEIDHNIFHSPTLQRSITLAYDNQCLPFPDADDYVYSPLLPTT